MVTKNNLMKIVLSILGFIVPFLLHSQTIDSLKLKIKIEQEYLQSLKDSLRKLSASENKSHLNMSFTSTLNYNYFLGNKTIVQSDNIIVDIKDIKYKDFSKIPSWGLQTGFFFSYYPRKIQFKRIALGWTTGLVYVLRKNILEISNNDILKNIQIGVYSYQTYYNIKKYSYTYHNIELPILFNILFNKHFNICFGSHIALFTHKISDYTYYAIDNSYLYLTQNPLIIYTAGSKRVEDYIWLYQIFPSFYFSYNFYIRKLNFTPIIGFDLGTFKLEDKFLYLKFGILINLFNNQ